VIMGKPLADIKGQVFGRLTVLERDSFVNGKTRWLCRCECGQSTVAIGQLLRNGKTRSCGCLRADRAAETATRHGGYVGRKPTRTMRIWKNMIQRTCNPNCPMYPRYGGAGIGVCESWQNFEGFLSDMGQAPDGLTLERVDNSKGYGQDNCKWATYAEQNRNKSSSKLLTLNGKTQAAVDWMAELNLTHDQIYKRIRRGWNDEEVLLGRPQRLPNSTLQAITQ
jgi:hypothetical protein